MGGRGTSSGVGGSSRSFNHLSDANDFFSVGRDSGMFPDWERGVSDEERNAAVYYTTEAYKEINKYLRGKNLADAPAKVQNAVRNIDTAMQKFNLTENITVFRGGSNKLVGGASTVEEIKAMIGAVVRDNGIMSTAVTRGGAWGSSGHNIGYEVEIPKGRGRGIFIDPISHYKGEQEFMVARGTEYRITGAYTDTHGNVVCKLKAVYRKKK